MRPALVAFTLVAAGGLSAGFAEPPVAKTADEQADEKMLRLQGYKPQMLRGAMVYCRRETPLGSHLPTTLKCITPEQAKMMAQEGRQTTERIQRGQTACLSTATLRGPSTGPANCGN